MKIWQPALVYFDLEEVLSASLDARGMVRVNNQRGSAPITGHSKGKANGRRHRRASRGRRFP